MKKTELTAAVADCKSETCAALQTVYNALNKGQRQKLTKADAVRSLFDRYGVEYAK